MEGILNLENWRKFGNDQVGYYIYPIASKVAYEIVINFHYLDTPIVTEIINDYKSNKIKEIIIIENQDTTYKYKY